MPAVGLVELGLHVVQTTRDVVPESDWIAARDAVAKQATPADLVLFAPSWTDPKGRLHFGDRLAPRSHEARPDETRFARVFEVSIRGAHRAELASFRKVSEERVGAVTIGVYENPAPKVVKTDLLERVGPAHMTVALTQGEDETACTWQRGAGQPGGLGVPQGPAIPGEKFVCPGGGYVGLAVLHALDHSPRLCLFASSPGGAGVLRVRFRDVSFGTSVHGYSGVQWVTERQDLRDRIELSLSAFDRPIGEHVHVLGEGWSRFEFPTPDLDGKEGELVFEVRGRAERQFCFEADTR